VTVHLQQTETGILLRLPSPPGAVHADYVEEVLPGGVWYGYTYAELLALGNGQHQLEPRQG
jgi:hypothetical protein